MMYFRLVSFVSAIVLIAGIGCSHVKPYYRSDDLKPSNISIDADSIKQRILFIGDAGEPQKQEPVLEHLQRWASLIPEKTTVVFLGDNIYPKGMPEENASNRHDAERRILAQINVVKESGAKGIFIPGNHDWANDGTTGRAALQRQAHFVNEMLSGENSFLPQNGCPGPAVVDTDGIRLIVLDTHVWYEANPEKIFADCQNTSGTAVIDQLRQIITEPPPEVEIIVVGHHPLISFGPRAGHFFWKDHVFPLTRLVDWLWIPLPVIGSLYPLSRSTFLKDKNDAGNAHHKKMKDGLVKAFSQNKPLIYAAGHDHSLQVLNGGTAADYLLVSGAGSHKKLYDVGHGKETLFAQSHAGFMSVDFLKEGKILLRAVEPGETEVVLELWLNERK